MTHTAQTSRRRLLIATVAAAVAVPAFARTGGASASRELRSLIEAHRKAYSAFIEHPSRAADRAEQEALLGICAFPARLDGDRSLKMHYLLEVEERGELDLPQHMQAVLRSIA
jgi:hypothetical protein